MILESYEVKYVESNANQCYHSAMIKALIRTMRPKQWTKNGFLFVGLIFDKQLFNLPALGCTFLGFAIFCLLSSTIYIINDIYDAEADRQHPRKRKRPIASGLLSKRTAGIAAGIFLALTLPAAYKLSLAFFYLALLYLMVNVVYSMRLKHIPIIDVLVLASLYVIRVSAGVNVIQVERFSPWLYLFTIFLALFIGIGKRRAELGLLSKNADNARKVLKGYTLPFLDNLVIIVLTCTILTYSLYTFSAPNLPENHFMMLTIPFVIYGNFRYLYLVQVENRGEAPEEILYTDRPLLLAILLWCISVFVIFYLT